MRGNECGEVHESTWPYRRIRTRRSSRSDEVNTHHQMTLGSWIRRLGHHQHDNAGGLDRKEIEELVANAGRVPRSVASSPAKTASVKRSRTVSGPTTLAEQYGRPAPRHVVVNKKPMVVRASVPSVPSDAPEPKLAEVPRAPKSVFEAGIAIPDEGERFPPVENRYVSYRASHVGGASVIPPEELGEVQPEDEDDTSSIEQGVLPYPEKKEEPVVDEEEVEVKESEVKEDDAADKPKAAAAPALDRTVLGSELEKTPSKSTKKGAKVKRSHTTGSSARSVPWDTTGSMSKDSAPTVFALNYATAVRHGREYLYRYSDYDNSPGESAPARVVTSTKTTESKGKEPEPRSKGETKFTEAIKPVESKKEASKATESAKTLDSVKAMEAQTSEAEAGKTVSEQAPPVPPKDVKKPTPTPTYTPSYLSGKPVEYKSELPSYMRTGKVTASIPARTTTTKESTSNVDSAKKEADEKAKKEADEKTAKEAAEKKAVDEKAKKEAEEKAAKEAEAKKEEKAAKEAEDKKAAEAKAAKEAEEKKAAEEKAAKETEAKKAAEEKAAKEAETKKAAEEKAAKEAEEKKAAEEKAAKEAEEKKAKEAAEKKAAEEKAAKEAEEKKAKEAAEKNAAEDKEAESKLSTKPSSKTLSSSASFSIPTSDRSKPAPAITGIDSLYGLPSATRESKPAVGEAKSVSDAKAPASRDASASGAAPASRDAPTSGAAPALAHASIYGKKGESKADTKEGKGIKSVLPEFMRQNSFDTSVSTRAIPPESRRNSDASARASLAESAKPSGLAPPINDTSVLGLAKSERTASEARGETKPGTPSTGTESKPAASTATEPAKSTTTESKPTPSKASVTHSIQSKPAPSTTAPAASEPEPKAAAAATPAPVSEKPAPKAEESKPIESKPAATPTAQRGMAVHILDSPSAAKANPAPKESVPAAKPAEDTKAETKPALPEKDAKRVEAAKEDAETKPAEAAKDAAATTKPTEAAKDATKDTAKDAPKDAAKDAPKPTETEAAAAKADAPKADAPKASEPAAVKPTETKPAVTKSTEASKEETEEKSSRNSSSILAAFRKKDKKKNKNKKK